MKNSPALRNSSSRTLLPCGIAPQGLARLLSGSLAGWLATGDQLAGLRGFSFDSFRFVSLGFRFVIISFRFVSLRNGVTIYPLRFVSAAAEGLSLRFVSAQIDSVPC